MDSQTTVGQFVVERPARARVFEKFGIDYCCGGRKPLKIVCQEKGLRPDDVLGALAVADADPKDDASRDWSRAGLAELADHIQATHHAFLKAELPRLDYLTERVARVHGARHPELAPLRQTFLAFKEELDLHMRKEEMILFPLCRELEAATTPVTSHCGSVANPIVVMMREHDDAGTALATMRSLTRDYVPPEGACNTYRAMLASLAELEADMHQHVHKENNILFPHALAREQELAS